MEEKQSIFKKDIKNEVYLGMSVLVIIFSLSWIIIWYDPGSVQIFGVGPFGGLFLVSGILALIRNWSHVFSPKKITKSFDILLTILGVITGLVGMFILVLFFSLASW
jgi:hypothetical protein